MAQVSCAHSPGRAGCDQGTSAWDNAILHQACEVCPTKSAAGSLLREEKTESGWPGASPEGGSLLWPKAGKLLCRLNQHCAPHPDMREPERPFPGGALD